jgi:hypothetical protein
MIKLYLQCPIHTWANDTSHTTLVKRAKATWGKKNSLKVGFSGFCDVAKMIIIQKII